MEHVLVVLPVLALAACSAHSGTFRDLPDHLLQCPNNGDVLKFLKVSLGTWHAIVFMARSCLTSTFVHKVARESDSRV